MCFVRTATVYQVLYLAICMYPLGLGLPGFEHSSAKIHESFEVKNPQLCIILR